MNTFRDFEHGAWEDAEVRLWHFSDIEAASSVSASEPFSDINAKQVHVR